jgi:hypothetical protein
MEARCVLCEVQTKIMVSGEGLNATGMSKATSSSPLSQEEHVGNQITPNMISVLARDLRPEGVVCGFSELSRIYSGLQRLNIHQMHLSKSIYIHNES